MTFTASTVRACKMLIATSFCTGRAGDSRLEPTRRSSEQMCTGDAMRLCASEIPDVERVTACMVQKRAQLSDALQGRLPIRAAGCRHAGELRPSAKPSGRST